MHSVKIACGFAAIMLAAGIAAVVHSAGGEQTTNAPINQLVNTNDFKKPDASQLKKSLTPEQFQVTQQCGTEPPFHNAYWQYHKKRDLRGRGVGGAAVQFAAEH